MGLWNWLHRKAQEQEPATWMPTAPPESWTLGDYWIDWHDIGLPYATRDAHGDIEQHESPPFPGRITGTWECHGRSAHYETVDADDQMYSASTPIQMLFEADENGYLVRVYGEGEAE